MTSDFEGFYIPDLIHYIFILQREPLVFPFFSGKQENNLVHFLLLYDAVLDWELNPGPPALDASTLPLGYRGGGVNTLNS